MKANVKRGPWFVSYFFLAFIFSACAGHKPSGDIQEPSETLPEIQFTLPVPEGWRTETIPFPIAFAPELEYQGLEELRFAPGMFTEGSDDYWTYAFVWWLEGKPPIEVATLKLELFDYFQGLINAVSESKDLDPSEFTTSIVLNEVAGSVSRVFIGLVETVDVFVTIKPVTLNIRVEMLDCSPQDITAVFFSLSPQPDKHLVWNSLQEIRQGFRCTRVD